jgi:hypothetical protein
MGVKVPRRALIGEWQFLRLMCCLLQVQYSYKVQAVTLSIPVERTRARKEMAAFFGDHLLSSSLYCGREVLFDLKQL